MNRRSFFTRAAATVAGAIAVIKGGELERTIEEIFERRTRYYRTYVMGKDAIFYDHEAIKSMKDNSVLKAIRSRQAIPMNMGGQRQFFQYKVT